MRNVKLLLALVAPLAVACNLKTFGGGDEHARRQKADQGEAAPAGEATKAPGEAAKAPAGEAAKPQSQAKP